MLEELTDRYGEPPEEVKHLIAVSRLRRMSQRLRLSEVVVMGDKLRIAPAELLDSKQVRLQRMYPGSKYHSAASAAIIPLPTGADDGALIEWTKDLLVSVFGAQDTAEELAEVALAAEAAEKLAADKAAAKAAERAEVAKDAGAAPTSAQ